jgi:glycine dehydrogenase subunit 1
MNRFIPRTTQEEASLLQAMGVEDFEALVEAVPSALRLNRPLDVPASRSELSVTRELEHLASLNQHSSQALSFLGMGWYQHYQPAAIDTVVSRSEFTTAYTPYQPEASQGSLQQIFEYQTMLCELLGMEISNASLYDGANALVESLAMAGSLAKGARHFLIASSVNPLWLEVARTSAAAHGWAFHMLAPDPATGRIDADHLTESVTKASASALECGDRLAALVIQTPNAFGLLEDPKELRALCDQHRLVLVIGQDPLAASLVEPAGHFGADIVFGEALGLGISTSFGGPSLGFLATLKKHLRQMPGRVVGRTLDSQGRRAYCLTAQTREQHIRREKATSNICSNQGLMTVAATLYLALHGPQGLAEVAAQCLERLAYLRNALALQGVPPLHVGPAFQEQAFSLPPGSRLRLTALAKDRSIFPGVWLHDHFPHLPEDALLVCTSELHTRADLDTLVNLVKEAL